MSRVCNGLPGQCAGRKAHRAYMCGHAQGYAGRPCCTPEWARSVACQNAWAQGWAAGKVGKREKEA